MNPDPMNTASVRTIATPQEDAGMQQLVKYRIEDGVGYLTLADPARRNALTAGLVQQALAAHQAFVDAGVLVGVLAAEGPVFCAGGDLKAKRIPGVPPAGVTLIERFEASPLLWIAALAGPALGAGIQLATAAARVVLAEDAWFAVPEFVHGRYPRPVVAALAEIIGARRTMRLMMTGERVDAAEAVRIGLAERVVPAADLGTTVAEEALALSTLPPETLTAARDAWHVRFGTRPTA